ncbi:hypothetical protein, partial [Dictyobacter arantiisoli]|uniref:hypothetical protein n=1 Tax=Dictyobacter arantiisoli TaxID=2014874 RepID=UPI00155B08D0
NWSLTSHGLVRAILVSPLLGGFVFLSLFLILSSPSTFSDKFFGAGKRREKGILGDTPNSGKGLAALCNPAEAVMKFTSSQPLFLVFAGTFRGMDLDWISPADWRGSVYVFCLDAFDVHPLLRRRYTM